jgi:hypothetical protein
MTDGETEGGPDPDTVRRPLPPEVPVPGPDAEVEGGGSGTEWWRKSAPLPPDVPAPPAEPPSPSPTSPSRPADWWSKDSGGGEAGAGASGWDAIRQEWRDDWSVHGQEGLQAAHEIGASIGESIAAHLPNPHAAAERRRLDIRWLRLKYNVPGIAIALLVTWGGRSATDRMVHSVAIDGIFAPLGWVLLPALLLLVLRFLPLGSVLSEALGHLVVALAQGVVSLVKQGWTIPYVGYLLRLAVAVAAWSFVFAVARLIGRATIHFLTGA